MTDYTTIDYTTYKVSKSLGLATLARSNVKNKIPAGSNGLVRGKNPKASRRNQGQER